jgi:hypothetical protein
MTKRNRVEVAHGVVAQFVWAIGDRVNDFDSVISMKLVEGVGVVDHEVEIDTFRRWLA